MKRLLATCFSILLAAAAAAQTVTPPAFDGVTVRFFAARLAGKAADAAVEQKIPFDSLSSRVCIAFRVDTAGIVTDLHFMDNTLTGRDSCNLPPATQPTCRLVEQSCARLEGAWTPAERDGRKIPYIVRTYVDLPVEEIGRRQGCYEPLRFRGEEPKKSFYDWMHERVRYDERYVSRRSEGIYRVRFYIEPDGTLAFDEVLEKNDDKLLREIMRVISNSKGQWTPRKVRGVPQRTEFVYSVNYN